MQPWLFFAARGGGSRAQSAVGRGKNMERPTTGFPKTWLSIHFANMLDGTLVSADSFLDWKQFPKAM